MTEMTNEALMTQMNKMPKTSQMKEFMMSCSLYFVLNAYVRLHGRFCQDVVSTHKRAVGGLSW